MKRTLELHQELPHIIINDPMDQDLILWKPGPETALSFEFREGGVKGVISLDLDFEAVTPSAQAQACTRMVVVIRGESDDDVSDNAFLDIAQELTDRYVNRLLSFVRVELGQHWVTPVRISDWELGEFLHQVDGWWLEHERQYMSGADVTEGFTTIGQPIVPESFDDRERPLDLRKREQVWEFVEKGREPSPEAELLANAKQHFVTSHFRMAAVEAVTALEIGLKRFMKELCNARGIAPELVDQVRVGLYVCLKLLIPLHLPTEELVAFEDLSHGCDRLGVVRNRVIHRAGALDLEDVGDIKAGITAVERVLELTSDEVRPPTSAVSAILSGPELVDAP